MKLLLKASFLGLLIVGLQMPTANFYLEAIAQEQEVEQQSEQIDQSEEQQKIQETPDGKAGGKGEDGKDGAAGEDGISGDAGESGEPNGEEAPVPTEESQPSEDGNDGENGENGMDGADGDIEEDGQDGGDATDEQAGGDGEDGAEGEVGENGEDATQSGESSEEDGEAIVETGDAISTGQIQNTGNTNVVNGPNPFSGDEGPIPLCSDKTRKDGEKGSKEEDDGEIDCIEENDGVGILETQNQNDANVQNVADIGANTGENDASGNNGSSIIDTGDATAIADIFNLINTNIIDSNGLVVLLSNLKKQLLDFDLRAWAPFMEGYEGSCGEECYRLGDLEIHSSNNGSITNSIVMRANTGGNEASENEGNATIETGDAYAAANVVNIVNTNIINSNYLLFVANSFGSFVGDIVFPKTGSFFSSLFATPAAVYDETQIINTNTATISNNVGVGAETGNNEANGNGAAFIQTGDSSAAANIFNQVNMNLFGGDSFAALIRVSGTWSGNVFGLPEGISWAQTPGGIMLYSDDLQFATGASYAEEPSCGECEEESKGKEGGKGPKKEHTELEIQNTNNATITNDIQVFALTGENKANNNGKGGSIQTGDAQAIANIVNIANTNVVGKNWLFAMFNILGDFSGNISFGRPDLWIGSRAEIPNDPLLPGDQITYYLTIANNGDASANNVEIRSLLDDFFFSFGSAYGEFEEKDGGLMWNFGQLLPGEGREVSFMGTIRADIPFWLSSFSNTSNVTATESDENIQDNTDTVQLEIFNEEPNPEPPNGNGGTENGDSDNGGPSAGNTGGSSNGGPALSVLNTSGLAPMLQVQKSFAGPETVSAGDAVDYTIIIANNGVVPAYDAVLYDVLLGEEGSKVNEEVWELGEIFPGEEVFVTYTMVFEKDASSGFYTNLAYVAASNGISNTAIATVLVKGLLLPPLALEGSAPLFSPEDFGGATLLAQREDFTVSSQSASTQSTIIERKHQPFLASLLESTQGLGGWLGGLAAAIAALLFLLFRRGLGQG